MGICLGNRHGNLQLHRFIISENIARSFRGGATFLTHTVHIQHWEQNNKKIIQHRKS